MRSRTLHLAQGAPPPELLSAAAGEAGRAPDLVLGFLPPEDGLCDTLACLAAAWPASLRFGCEAVTQFADGDMTTGGSLQLFWFDQPDHHARVEVVTGTHEEPPTPGMVAGLAQQLSGSGGALLIVDGLRFPAERFLNDLRVGLQELRLERDPLVAGGLASQELPVTRAGARVFFQERIYSAACLAVVFHGVEMRVEVVRGWSPASPVYTVTRAEGNVVHEIDGEAAAEWYRRFFTVGGELAPMPDSAWRFPLLIEGPAPERQGLYRSMRAFDDPAGAVTYWGNVQTGDRVRLGIGNDRSLVDTASQLSAGRVPEAAILYSCVGREVVLGERAPDEAASIHRALGGAALSGFFTFGEIGPTPRGGLAFYNQTAILVLLSEERA